MEHASHIDSHCYVGSVYSSITLR